MPRFPRPRFPSKRTLLITFGVTFVVLLVIAVVAPVRNAVALGVSKTIVFVASPLAPDIADFKQLPQTTKIVAIDNSVVAELDKSERRVPITVDALPNHVKEAVLAAEDQDFYSHDGVDSTAIFRAFLRSAQGRTQGGSTITQQLAKINYTARERTAARKLKEVLYAAKLEKKYSKDELLERYLNQIYFGDGAYGINAAAQAYFGINADQLSPAQAALLAGKIRAPEALDPRAPEDVKPTQTRRDQVLRNMKQEGYLDQAEFDAAVATQVEGSLSAPLQDNDGLGLAPHFAEYVKREARSLDALGSTAETRENQLFTGGYTIETTFDPKIFEATKASVTERMGLPEDPVTALATVVPGDGAIRSLFGGLDFSKTQQDMAGHPAAGRQIGSSAKPFVYLAALRKGIDPRNTYDGTSGRVIPCYVPDKPVNNYAGEDAAGQINVDDAMVKSVNVVFAELGCAATGREVLQTAVDAGLPKDIVTKFPGSLFLGGIDGNGPTALQMASAYATFAAKGVRAEPYSIARIKDSKDRVIYEHKVKTDQAFKPEEVGVLNNPLQRVVTEGTAKAANIGRPLAGKTGTTQDNIDAWFVGYTPQLATGVWMGYFDDGDPATPIQPMSKVHGRAVTGGSFPAQIFSDVMKKAHEGIKATPLFTASPDQLNLQPTTTTSSSTSSTTSSSTTTTSSSVPETTTTTAPGQVTTTTAPPAVPARPTTTAAPTTTTTRPPTTTTTAPTTTTTAAPTTTTTTRKP